MSAMLEVKRGPFAGRPLEANLTPSANAITTMAIVGLVEATQLFLETFKPTEGWAVTVEGTLMDLNMVPLANELVGSDVRCPTALFKAALLKDGAVVNQASSVWIISGATEWEKGETNARLRLYAALGLPIRQDLGLVDLTGNAFKPKLLAVPSPYAKAKDEAPPKIQDSSVIDSVPVDVEEPVAEQVQSAPEPVVEAPISEPLALTSEKPESSPVRRQKGSPTDQPAKTVLENIKRICDMRGIDMPELSTKQDAETFLKSILTRSA